MIPVFFADWPLLLLPVHIVFLELIIDPACSLIFEAEQAEADVMQRPPRNPADRLFSIQTISVAVMQGLSVLAVCLGVFLLARSSHSAEVARALTFATLVVAFIVIILVNRSWTRSAVAMLRVPNTASTYADQCGACHFTYQPELLPAASWKIILDGTDANHRHSLYSQGTP